MHKVIAQANHQLSSLGHNKRPPRAWTRAQHRMPVPGRYVRPGLASVVADDLAGCQLVRPMARSKTAHCVSRLIAPARERRRAVAAATEAVDGRVQTAGWRADPSYDDLTPAIGEPPDTAREVAREGDFTRRERQLRQGVAVVVRGPIAEAGAGARCAVCLVDKRGGSRGDRCQKKGEHRPSGSRRPQAGASTRCSRVRTHRIATAARPNAAMPMPSCHQPGACGMRPAST